MTQQENRRDCIECFLEEYEFLSNFYPARLRFDGITYLSSETAYQAQKLVDPEERRKFSRLPSSEAKRQGSSIEVRPDWDEVKLPLMEKIVRAKFTQNPYLAEYLLETGDKVIEEGNLWEDVFWGVDLRTGEGENHLGQILMALRSEFREKGIPEATERPEPMAFGPVNGISVEFGDISQSDCECVVNSADGTLLDGDRAIYRAAGKELLEECRELNGCPAGEAKITKGYRLKAKYIIHAVGPHYGVKQDEELLRQAYRSSLALARQYNIHSIAFPAISVGRSSYPKKEATQIAVETVNEWMKENEDHPMNIVFTCADSRIYDCFCESVNGSV